MQILTNYTLQDVLGTMLAVMVFPVVFVVPGYSAGWLFDLFNFKQRRPLTRFLTGILLSFAISPILFFLIFRFLPRNFIYIIAAAITILFVVILYRTPGSLQIIQLNRQDKPNRQIKFLLWGTLAWIVFLVLFLVEFQSDHRLYYNVVAYDYSTRVAIVNAITNSGVPPINPGYYPGHPVYLTYLYYFWYILCSFVDMVGGKWITAYEAMMASVIWCNLGLMSAVAFYLRLRLPGVGEKIWNSSLAGVGLLLVSGADIIALMVTLTWGVTGGLNGDIEHWNEQITAWVGALSWVPHHAAAMIACIVGVMLYLHARGQNGRQRTSNFVIAGLAFASSFGLSVFVTIVFVICWGIWILFHAFKKDFRLASLMSLSGFIGLLVICPFIADLLGGSGGEASTFPLTLAVRVFRPIAPLMIGFPLWLKNIIYFLALPVNYFFELGFFFYAGMQWYRHNRKSWQENRFHASEITILVIVLFVGSFVRSTTISSNDIGWRAWLPGQFVLLIWGVDIIDKIINERRAQPQSLLPSLAEPHFVLQLFLIIGLLTTLTDVIMLRVTPILVDSGSVALPNSFSPDTNFGNRTFAARDFYEYLNDHLPDNTVIQINPTDSVDRAIGLYSNQQSAVSVHTAFGIPEQELNDRISRISAMFALTNWFSIDEYCNKYFVDIMIVNDLDPLWKKLDILETQRAPVYKNQYYAAFQCGE